MCRCRRNSNRSLRLQFQVPLLIENKHPPSTFLVLNKQNKRVLAQRCFALRHAHTGRRHTHARTHSLTHMHTQRSRALSPLYQGEKLRNPVPESFNWASEIGSSSSGSDQCRMRNEALRRTCANISKKVLDSPELDTLYFLTDIWRVSTFRLTTYALRLIVTAPGRRMQLQAFVQSG
jgi:hypothetical protein